MRTSNNTAVAIIFGRFNPPHQGHVAAWRLAAQYPHWYVGTHPETQNEKNPLPADIKTQAMLALYPQLDQHLLESQTWLSLADWVYAQHGEVDLVCITDESWVTPTLEKYNGQARAGGGYYKFASIRQEPAPRLSSATALRAAVKSGDVAGFYQAAGPGSEKIKIQGQSYFDIVKHYLDQQSTPVKKTPAKSRSTKTPPAQSLSEQRELRSFLKFQKHLNPRLWSRDVLRPEVRQQLLEIAQLFEQELDLPDLEIQDVTLSGSNAAYTYGPQSDIDVHLIARVPKAQQPLMRKYLDAKKNLFNQIHDIRVRQHPVEMYVQFSNQPHTSAGIYSLTRDAWIHRPQQIQARYQDQDVISKARYFVDALIRALAARDAEAITQVITRLRNYRRQALDHTGEGSTGNVTFKTLRNLGVLDWAQEARTVIQDRALSLAENQGNP